MHPWVIDLVGCAVGDCGGRLAVQEERSRRGARLRDGVLVCKRCKAVFPVVGGIPILVADPSAWSAQYFESALAALVQAGLASKAAVDLLEVFAEATADAEPLRFGDDWIADEGAGFDGDAIPGDRPAAALFRSFAAEAAGDNPGRVLLQFALAGRRSLGTVVELGAGAGQLARALRPRAERVLVGDLSLRAAVRAVQVAGRGGGAPVAGAVVDADGLHLHAGKVDTLAAANLIDLLSAPAGFLAAAKAGLKRRGRLLLSTPEPALGSGNDRQLDELLDAVGFTVQEAADGVAWLRPHSGRFVQVYFARVLSACPA